MRFWVSDVGFSMADAYMDANANGPRFARTSLRSDLASLGPRFARRRPNLKNTESFRSWPFSTRNDRKEILRCLRGNIDFKTLLVEVGFFGKSVNFLNFGILEFSTIELFQNFEKIIHRKSDSP